MKSFGLTNISFFGPDGSTQSYIDADGAFRYERDKSGAEFTYEVNLSPSRSVTVRVVAFGHTRPLDELEVDAKEQLRRTLKAMAQVADEI